MLLCYVVLLLVCRLKDDPKVSKYVKIAAALPDKTVRDVALRCRWMTVSLGFPLCFLGSK